MGILFFLLFQVVNFASASDVACFNLFEIDRGPVEIAPAAQLKPGFLWKHTTKYDVDLTATNPIKNQCAFGVCHLYAWGAHIENRRNVEISQEYLTAAYIYNSAMEALQSGNIKAAGHFSDSLGSGPIDSLLAIRNVGIIPKGAWTGKVDFNKEPMASRLLEGIEAILTNALYFRKNEPDDKMRKMITDEAANQINAFMGDLIGAFPDKFIYQGREYNARTFSQEFFPELYKPITTFRVATHEDSSAIGVQTQSITDITTGISDIERIAKAVLDSGTTMQLGYEHKHQYVDAKTGIMTIDGFSYPFFAAPLSRPIKEENNAYSGFHAVELVGYEADPVTGVVLKWKIKNSWGDKSGDHGFYHMYADYFHNFVTSISYLDNGKVTLPPFTQTPLQLSLKF